jgi:hypothetical protein
MLAPRLPVSNLARVDGLAAADDKNAGLVDEKFLKSVPVERKNLLADFRNGQILDGA